MNSINKLKTIERVISDLSSLLGDKLLTKNLTTAIDKDLVKAIGAAKLARTRLALAVLAEKRLKDNRFMKRGSYETV